MGPLITLFPAGQTPTENPTTHALGQLTDPLDCRAFCCLIPWPLRFHYLMEERLPASQ